MELKDTVDGMLSEDYKERFKAEYNQVVIRRNKLYKMLSDFVDNKLCFEPKCNVSLLMAQLDVMNAYINILILRAEVEEIELGNPPRVEE